MHEAFGTTALTQELQKSGFEPWLEADDNGVRDCFGLSILRGTVHLIRKQPTEDDNGIVPVDLRLLLGPDIAFVPTEVDTQETQFLGDQASLFDTLVAPLFARLNNGRRSFGANAALTALMERYCAVRAVDTTVPLTMIVAHGGNENGAHMLWTSPGKTVSTGAVLRDVQKNMRKTTNVYAGHPVLLGSCNTSPSGEAARLNVPGLHVLYYSGIVSLAGDQMPKWNPSAIDYRPKTKA